MNRLELQLGDITLNHNAELNMIVLNEIRSASDAYFETLSPLPLEPEMFGLQNGGIFPIRRVITGDDRWGLRLEGGKFYFVVLAGQGEPCKVCQVQHFHHLQHLVRDVGGDEKQLYEKLYEYWR